MKQDILQMNLYVWIQKLKNILTMPWLEDISEEMLEKLWKIEKQVVNSHVSVFVIQEEPIEIYLPHIFLKRNHMELFYMNQQVLINEINEEWVGIIIFVLREPFDLENIISNIIKIKKIKPHTIVLILKNEDEIPPSVVVEEIINEKIKDNEDMPEELEIHYLPYVQSKVYEGQKLRDEHLIYESKFLFVKEKLQEYAAVLLSEIIIPECYFEYLKVLDLCKENLNFKIQKYKDEREYLIRIKNKTDTGSINYIKEMKEISISQCKIEMGFISFSSRPDNIPMAKKMMVETVNKKIDTVFLPQINQNLKRSIEIVEINYQNWIDKLLQELQNLMEIKNSIRLKELRDSLYIKNKDFNFLTFSMILDDFSKISLKIESDDLEQKMNEALQKSLHRYNLALQYSIEQWFDNVQKQLTEKLSELLEIINENIDFKIKENECLSDNIANSITYLELKKLSAQKDEFIQKIKTKYNLQED